MNSNTVFLREVSLKDINYVGGKNASLGELIQTFDMIPHGFAVTTFAYNRFIEYNNLKNKIHTQLTKINFDDLESLKLHGNMIRHFVKSAVFPPDVEDDIRKKYVALSEEYGLIDVDVAVRSSSTAEDLPDASFAGQQDTYLNVKGAEDVLNSIKDCFASLYTDRAISYRHDINYDVNNISISVGVQKMVRSDVGSAGVCFSIDTETGFQDVIIINAAYGLGELVVGGDVRPDEFIVYKPFLGKTENPIIDKKIGHKNIKMIYGSKEEKTRIEDVSPEEQNRFCISDEIALELATHVKNIETHYKCPVDIEWAYDGQLKRLFIVQTRPETVASKWCNKATIVEHKIINNELSPFVQGIAVGGSIAFGKVKVIENIDSPEVKDFNKGDILVTGITTPDWEVIMKKAGGIITDQGGRTCHSAIVARELGVPAVVGCQTAVSKFKDVHAVNYSGDNGSDVEVTISCCEGETGNIYLGKVQYEKTEIDVSSLKSDSHTKIMMNIASPEIAFHYARYPCAGVGLAREEFIINNFIKVHPLALLNYKQQDPALIKEIDELIKGYSDPTDYYVKKLAYGIARIAASFYPNDVIVRFSDFKTNEYYNLLGGKYYEPKEENPMIGFRGASRYYSPEFKPAFGLECLAIKHVREIIGLTNVVVMIPFCRTVKELKQVEAVMAEYGLVRGENGLRLFLMCEIPSNVILANEFAKHIDGFSIGSNDLTQLTLGLDRDSAYISHIYDEQDEAVKTLIRKVIKKAKKNGVKIGLCGQGPSDNPEFAKFLIEEGIDSMSVTPDTFFKTYRMVSE